MATIGVQAMMLKDSVAEIGAFETLRKVSNLGYNAVEISQIPMNEKNVGELEQAQRELGMDVAALSVMMERPVVGPAGMSLNDDMPKIISDAQRLDTTLLRIGMMPFRCMKNLHTVVDFAKKANDYAEELREAGLRLYYHNHHIEFARVEGRFMIDVLTEHSPAMGLEIDVHWVARGGLDPVRTLQKYADKTAMVHLKDYRIGFPSAEAFAALEAGDSETFLAEYKQIVQFAEVGEGNLDFLNIVPTALAGGAEYLLVEQDELYGRSVWEALETSHRNLTALGFANLF